MMNFYPAIRAHMGDWTYYVVKMKMRELASDVAYAAEIYEDRTLDEAIQRVLKEHRVRKEIALYLARREDRFFSSIVVACLGGNPLFYPVKITGEEKFKVFADQHMDEAFGVLSFTGGQKYYALDGQHRLKAIKTLLDRTDELSRLMPEGFPDEEISVIMIVRDKEDPAFLQAYRRLFSSLNRYAKPTDRDTNIIMDEDDAFAILTRRLITDHEFFRWAGRQKESPHVQTAGKNVKTGDPYFTSLQTLYYMNEHLLSARWRLNAGWGNFADGEKEDTNTFKRFRPSEEYLDELYDELVIYWDDLLRAIPDLRKDPTTMRFHDAEDLDDQNARDHLLFWPIGQEILADVTRRLLDTRLADPKKPHPGAVEKALKPLGKVDWSLHTPPWRYFLLVYDQTKKVPWRMRSDDRKDVVDKAKVILSWMVGIDDLNSQEVDELRLEWQTRLSPAQEHKDELEMWRVVEGKRAEIAKSLQ